MENNAVTTCFLATMNETKPINCKKKKKKKEKKKNFLLQTHD